MLVYLIYRVLFALQTFNYLAQQTCPNHQQSKILQKQISVLELDRASSAKNNRDSAFKSYCENKNEVNWRLYCRYRNRVTKIIRKGKAMHGVRIFNQASSKKIWNILNKSDLSPSQQNELPDITSEELNHLFIGDNTSNSSVPDEHIPEAEKAFSFRNITLSDLWSAISKISSNAVEVDEIPITFIKMVFPVFGKYFLHLFNTILTTSVFPENWKMSLVTPIPKVTSPKFASDFRPISILPGLSKSMEFVVRSQIEEAIPLDELIFKNQSGFRKYHSPTSAIVNVTESIRNHLNDGNISFLVLVLLDFKNAFGSVDYGVLVNKLKSNFRFSSSSCKLIYNYLSHRYQAVRFNDEVSTFAEIKFGVPQGSLLGPLLFSLFLNDLLITPISFNNIFLLTMFKSFIRVKCDP